MKNDIKSYSLILILFFAITFPAYSALFHSGMLTSHDGEGHIIRMFEFNTAVADGHFPVRWSKRLNWGLGYPYFNFNYPLTYYLTYFLSRLGFDLLAAFKIILLLSFPLSGFFTFLWLKEHFSKVASFAGAMFYTLIPYHFLNVYVRGNIAETLALTVVPLGFYSIIKLNKQPSLRKTILLGLCLSSIILFHNITALLFLPILLIYSLLLGVTKKYFKFILGAFVLPIFITCFFWFPVLVTKPLITIDKTFPLYYLKNFSSLRDLIYSPWGYGGSHTGPGQMSVQVGVLHLLFLVVSIIILAKRPKKLSLFFLGLSALTIFMMLPESKFIWDFTLPIQYIQFPWRLLAILALTISFLSAYVLKFIPKKATVFVVIVLVLGLLYVNRNHWRANEYYQLPSYWFQNSPYRSTTTVDGEHTPKWQLEDRSPESARFEIISGQADIKSLEWQTNYHKFSVNSELDSQVIDRTVYFPGWTVFVDGKKVNRIDQNNPKTKGLIAFVVSKGRHLVEVKLLEPDSYKIADAISIVTVIMLIIVICRPLIRK